MITNSEKSITNTFSGQGQSRQMTLDKDSLSHIMSVLTNLYSDPQLAVIREYTTNAYDSHIAAGKADVPVEVTLPDTFNPTFTVRDYGVGLSEDEVFEVFGSYGKSTKRESNDLIGALGLGCKSALTYTNQFSLTAVKNGHKGVYSVHLDEYGVGKITQLHSAITDEVNGVQISIPVKDVHSFLNKAKEFYRFFEPLPKFINSPTFSDNLSYTTLMQLTEDAKLVKFPNNSGDFVRMGGIAYPFTHRDLVSDSYKNASFNSGTLVIDAPMGAVDFVPSREKLHFTKRTISFLKDKINLAKEEFVKNVEVEFESYPNIKEAVEYAQRIRDDLPSTTVLTYRGMEFSVRDDLWRTPTLDKFVEVPYYTMSKSGYETNYRYGSTINAFSLAYKGIIIEVPLKEDSNIPHGFTRHAHRGISAYDRGCISTVARDNDFTNILLIEDASKIHPLLMEVLVDVEVATITDIKSRASAIRRANYQTRQKTLEEAKTYLIVSIDYRGLHEKGYFELTAPTIVYGTAEEYRQYETLLKAVDDVQFVKLRTNQVTKFSGNYPEAITINAYLTNLVNNHLSSLDKKELTTLAILHTGSQLPFIRTINNPRIHDTSNVKDVQLKDFLDICLSYRAGVTSEISFINKATTLIPLSPSWVNIIKKEVEELTATYEELRSKYELLLNDTWNPDYWINYINNINKEEN